MTDGDSLPFMGGITIRPDRRIVHIATMPDGPLNNAALYALTANGELWARSLDETLKQSWRLIPPIPQPESGPNRPLP